jgi:hypothetical protein
MEDGVRENPVNWQSSASQFSLPIHPSSLINQPCG